MAYRLLINIPGPAITTEEALREEAQGPVGVPVDDQPEQTYFMASDSGYCQMSFYAAPENGRKTAFGEIFDSLALTCAIDFFTPIFHNDWMEISDGASACTVRVNDRMSLKTCAKFPERDIDLSQAAAAKMGMLTDGVRRMKWRKIKTK